MASGVTEQALDRLSHLPDNPGNPAVRIAGQKYYDIEFTGGNISNVELTDCTFNGGDFPSQITSFGTNNELVNGELIFTYNYLDYDYDNIIQGNPITGTLQSFLIKCYLNSVKMGAIILSDQGPRVRTIAQCNATWPLHAYCPIIVPPFVDFDFTTTLIRSYPQTPNITNFYNGDTTSGANANKWQPSLILAAQAHSANALLYLNPDGVNGGSGFFATRAWTMQGNPPIGNPGSGYVNGETVYLTNPHRQPYARSSYTLTVVGGVVTGATLVSGGLWPMPPKLLREAWGSVEWLETQAPIFGANGYWIVSGGSGTGLTLNVADDTTCWQADFSGGQYTADFGDMQTDCQLGNISTLAGGLLNSGTYGPMRSAMICNTQLFINNLSTQGGYYGNVCYASDVQIGNCFYNVGAAKSQFVKFAGGGIHGRVICDSPQGPDGYYFDISHFEGSTLELYCFNNGSQNLDNIPFAGYIGGNNVSAGDTGFVSATGLKIYFQNAGNTTGIPALFINRCSGTSIDLHVTNKDTHGGTVTRLLTHLATFGANNSNGNTITGSCDGIAGAAMFTNALPVGFTSLIANDTEGGYIANSINGGGGGGTTIGGAVTGGTANSVLYVNGSTNLAQSTNLTYNGSTLAANGLAITGNSAITGTETVTGTLTVDGVPPRLNFNRSGSNLYFMAIDSGSNLHLDLVGFGALQYWLANAGVPYLNYTTPVAFTNPANLFSPSAQVHIQSATSTTKTLIVQGAASQTQPLQQWQNSSNVTLSSVDANGYHLMVTGSGAPVSTPNDGALYLDITNSKLYARVAGAWKSMILT